MIQKTDDSGLDQSGGSGKGKSCLDSRFSLKVEWTGFADGLDGRFKRKREVEDDS